MGLEFDSKRLDTVKLIRNGSEATLRFSTRVLYFETLSRLKELWESLANDPSVDVVYFESDDKNFLLGADVDYFYEAVTARRVDLVATYSDLGNDLFDAIEKAAFPTIAKLTGAAMGGGFELALACSARVAARGVSLEFPETGLGIFPGWGGIKRLSRKLGQPLAKWLVYTGKPLGAPLALELGVVDALVSPDELDATARKLAQEARGGKRSNARLEKIPESLERTREFFDRPLAEITANVPNDPEGRRLYKSVARRAPYSLEFAERIFNAVEQNTPTMERRVEDVLTWRIYQTRDAELGLDQARRGAVVKTAFTGALDEFYAIFPNNL